MTRSETSRKSTRVVSELIGYTYSERGYERLCGEVARAQEPHARSLNDGQAQTMHSQYMNRLAVDLNLFIDGHDQSFVEAYQPLADDEVRLDPEHHIWGGQMFGGRGRIDSSASASSRGDT